jgi:uncharacterized MAPEG superfamily protein
MQPALQLLALFSAILGLHLLALALWTGTVRAMKKKFVNPEDVALNKGTQVEAEHPDVARVKRAHQNALENAVPFFAIAYFYAATGPSKSGALIYFGTFTAARILHSVFYLWGRQPFRTITFAVGVLTTIGMAVQVIRSAV